MSITDELREYAHDCCARVDDAIHAIADRIDAEHQKAEDELRAKNGDMWQKGYAVCHEELMEGHPVIVADLEKCGWVRLPKDADGVPIHVGDVMEWPTTGETFEVVGIGEGTLFYVEDGSECADWTGASTKRHHHATTVEDVLQEILFKAHIYDKREMELLPDLIAEYASKLQLKEDA